MSNDSMPFGGKWFTGPRTWNLVHNERTVLLVECADGAPRIYVDGQQTSDVERIGAAFVEWAKLVAADSESDTGAGSSR